MNLDPKKLRDALSRLKQCDPGLSRAVELRLFRGLTEAEAAEALGVSLIAVKRDWHLATAWLYAEIGPMSGA
jgi:DNA-directed RNA polymerase specialized sigma24 family protein